MAEPDAHSLEIGQGGRGQLLQEPTAGDLHPCIGRCKACAFLMIQPFFPSLEDDELHSLAGKGFPNFSGHLCASRDTKSA